MRNGPRGTRFASKDSGGKTHIQARPIEEWSILRCGTGLGTTRFASEDARSSNKGVLGLYVPFAVTV
jgi:hypothetical protein